MSGVLLGSVLVASLVGSLHCAGMCGPFVAFYAGNDTTAGRRRAFAHLAYHAGRLVTYVALGTLAGALGKVIDLGGAAVGIRQGAALAAGVAMIVWASLLLLEHAGVTRIGARMPRALHETVLRVTRHASERPPVARALLIGLSTTLLPCGFLWAFVAVAAGTGSPLGGAVTMLWFWAGSVPLLLGAGVALSGLIAPLRRHVPLVSALCLLGVGLFAIFGRMNLPAQAALEARSALTLDSARQPPACHHTGSP